MDKTTELEIAAIADRGYRDGKTIVDVIKTVREQFSLSLGEAKLVVSRQPCWLQVVQAAQPLHDIAIRVLKSTSDE